MPSATSWASRPGSGVRGPPDGLQQQAGGAAILGGGRSERPDEPSGNAVLDMDGGPKQLGYGMFTVGGGREVCAHVFAYGLVGPVPAGHEVDHRCHKIVRQPNASAPGHQQSGQAESIGSTAQQPSGVRGMSWEKRRNRWVVTVWHQGRMHWVGRFKDLAEAEAAAITERNELFTHNDLDRGPTNRLRDSGLRHRGRQAL